VYYGLAAMFFFQALFTYSPFMQSVFGTYPLELGQLIRIYGAGIILSTFITFEKNIRFRSEHTKR